MRLIHAVIAALLLAFLSSPAVSATPEPSTYKAQRARVTISASPEWVRKGGIVTLTGTVKGVRGRVSVTIFQKTKGKSWVVEAVKRTSRKGRFNHREDVKSGDRTYRACVKRACDSVLVHMGKPPVPVVTAADTAVSITGVGAASVEAGTPFVVSGGATPNLNGRVVEVQAYDGPSATWGAVGRATVQNGTWSASTVVTTAGRSVPLRAAFSGGIALNPSASTASSITVFGWYYLYDEFPEVVAGSNDSSWQSFNVNGVNYSKSIGLEGSTGYTSYLEFNIGRSCTRLAATIGLSDDASTSTRSNGRVMVDNVTRWTQSGIALGAAYPVDLDISNGLRLRVEDTESTSGYGDLVFGDVRVLCAF